VSRPRSALVASIVLVALVFLALATQPEDLPNIAPLPGSLDLAELDSDEQREIARRFRPHLLFDRDERWRPVEVRAFLAEGRHRVCAGDDCRPVATADELVAAASQRGLRMNVGGRRAHGDDYRNPKLAACSENLLHDCNSGPASVIYANLHPAAGRTHIDYWWFFRYNDFPERGLSLCGGLAQAFRKLCGDHEGDWEGITVVTDDPPTRVLYAIFAQHDGRLRLDPGPLGSLAERRFTFARGGRRHIRVFVAQGSHAAYPSACRRRFGRVFCRQDNGLPEGFHDGSRDWGHNSDANCEQGRGCVLLLPRVPATANAGEPLLYASSWNAWPGLWGFCGPGEARCAKGPRSPGMQTRYQRPTNTLAPQLEIPDAAVPLPQARRVR
jgi:hypothetical protein